MSPARARTGRRSGPGTGVPHQPQRGRRRSAPAASTARSRPAAARTSTSAAQPPPSTAASPFSWTATVTCCSRLRRAGRPTPAGTPATRDGRSRSRGPAPARRAAPARRRRATRPPSTSGRRPSERGRPPAGGGARSRNGASEEPGATRSSSAWRSSSPARAASSDGCQPPAAAARTTRSRWRPPMPGSARRMMVIRSPRNRCAASAVVRSPSARGTRARRGARRPTRRASRSTPTARLTRDMWAHGQRFCELQPRLGLGGHSGSHAGNVTVNAVPSPGALRTSIRPP